MNARPSFAADFGLGPTREIRIASAAAVGTWSSALVGLYALATAGPVGPVPLLIVGSALAFVALRDGGIRHFDEAGTPPSRWTGLGTFLIALVVVPVHSLLAGSWLLGAVDLLVLVQANRLLAMRRGSKAVIGQVLVVSLLMLLAAAVLTIGFSFLGSVFFFCLVGTWTAVFRTLLEPSARGADARVPRNVAGIALGAGVALFVLTCALFAVLPRVQFQALQAGFLSVQGVSGFSEEVQIGDIGSVKQDTSPVFRAQISGPGVNPDRFHWRGLSLDRYGEGRWWVSDAEEIEIRPRANHRSREMLFQLNAGSGEPVRQEITLEPLDVSVLFGLGRMQSIEGELALVTRNSTDSFFFRASRFGRLRYVVLSDADTPDAADVRDEAIGEVPSRYLQIPEPVQAALEPIARELAGEGSPWRKARRIEAALQTWEYSFDSPRGTHADPVVSFVTETRKGWCEQYASAMVLMLRSVGIPARMTNGFHGGERNEFGEYWLVRNSDAHSWVEVPFENAGWVAFDPTPGQGPARRPLGGSVRRIYDWVRQLWLQRIVTYDIVDQFEALRAASRSAETFRDSLSQTFDQGLAGAKSLLAAGVAAAGTLGLILLARRRRSRPTSPAARAAAEAERWWKLVERHFRKAGILRRAGETPKELASRAGQPEWADLYYVARFGMRPLTGAERDRIEQIREGL